MSKTVPWLKLWQCLHHTFHEFTVLRLTKADSQLLAPSARARSSGVAAPPPSAAPAALAPGHHDNTHHLSQHSCTQAKVWVNIHATHNTLQLGLLLHAAHNTQQLGLLFHATHNN